MRLTENDIHSSVSPINTTYHSSVPLQPTLLLHFRSHRCVPKMISSFLNTGGSLIVALVIALALGVRAGSTTGFNNPVALTGTPSPAIYNSPAIATDASGNTWFINTYHAGTATYGSLSRTAANMSVVLVKQTSAKAFVTATMFQCTSLASDLVVSDLVIDSLGNPIVAGSVRGSLAINTTWVLTSSSGRLNPFLIKYSTAGVATNAVIASNPNADAFISSLAIDLATNNVYGGGGYRSTMSFAGVSFPNAGSGTDGFLIEVSSSLVGTDSAVITGSGYDTVRVSALNYHAASNALLVAANFNGTASAGGSSSFSAGALGNTLVAEYSSALSLKWAAAGTFSITGTDSSAASASISRCGDVIYTGGNFVTAGGAFYNLGSSSLSSGGIDGYVTAINATTHAFTSANQFFSTDAKVVSLQCNPATGGAWVGGNYRTSATLSGTVVSTTNPNYDMVVATVSPSSVFGSVSTPVISGSGVSVIQDMAFHANGLLAITGLQNGGVNYGTKKITSSDGFLAFYQP